MSSKPTPRDEFVFVPVTLDGIDLGYWKGPAVSGNGWEVQTAWNADEGVTLALTQPTTELDPTQALAAGQALTETAAKYLQRM